LTNIAFLPAALILLSDEQQLPTQEIGGDIMSEKKLQDYWDNEDEGHVDTREKNFECEKPDEHLGCDLGIDVQG
jgi:hypothetical protein